MPVGSRPPAKDTRGLRHDTRRVFALFADFFSRHVSARPERNAICREAEETLRFLFSIWAIKRRPLARPDRDGSGGRCRQAFRPSSCLAKGKGGEHCVASPTRVWARRSPFPTAPYRACSLR
ncbi:hypothetical protein HPB50_024946 [Hyalomma asiaticum]|uniref:Uncharacterized protein n=1 Tax=Hyalomma asiaticum TaxID=266040 RepID=A0ACB7TQQ9_HYAAI|nr:hypothetical protein HPB50_024946 [Hyalomma asiaticum]